MAFNEESKTRTKLTDDKIRMIKERVNVHEQKINQCELKLASHGTQIDVVLDTVVQNSRATDEKLLEFDAKLEATNDRIAKEICYMQGQHKVDELILSGIPHKPNENLRSHVINIAKSLKINMITDHIRKVNRLTGQQNTQTDRIPPIMVKFSSQEFRDAINDAYIENMKKKTPLKLSSIMAVSTGQVDSRIYINPHLPQCLRDIHQKALKLKKDGRFEAVHARVNAVAIRMNGTWHRVQTMNELRDVTLGKPLAD